MMLDVQVAYGDWEPTKPLLLFLLSENVNEKVGPSLPCQLQSSNRNASKQADG